MGNHDAGRAMAMGAELAMVTRTDQKALDLLDIICEPYRGCDAEFDDSFAPDEPLGKLAMEAFAPGQAFPCDSEEEWERWYNEVNEPFSKRYGLC